MPEIIVDNEPVDFNGPIPEDPKVIYDLLFEALANDRKSVIEYIVDGKNVLEDAEQNFPSQFETIHATSITHAKLTLRLINSTLDLCQNTVAELDSYSRRVLINSWSIVFEKMDEFINKVNPLVQLMDGLQPYASSYQPSWQKEFESIQESNKIAFESVLSGFQRGDTACLSEAIFDKLIPVVEKSISFLKGTVTQDLEAQP